jgi:hypothetical protein
MAIDFILGDWSMRRGDRLPMIGLALESDTGVPLDLTGAVCTLMLRHQDGGSVLSITTDIFETRNGWLMLPAFVYDAPNGVVVYDWPQFETESLRVGVMFMQVEVTWAATGEKIVVPTDRDARLVIRPVAWPMSFPAGWADTVFTAINAGGEYSTLGGWNTSTPGQVAGP